MEISESILDLVGNTPLVRLARLIDSERLTCDLLAKVEVTNPGGSVKDRVAIAMVDAAEESGVLQPGGTIVEPTSGNTGAGLAIVAAQRGYRCIFVMSDKMSDEKIALLETKRAEYESWVQRREAMMRKADDSVVAILSQMRPDAAALQIAAMDREVAAAILAKLNARVASAILNEIEPATAAQLTSAIAGAAQRPKNEGKPG